MRGLRRACHSAAPVQAMASRGDALVDRTEKQIVALLTLPLSSVRSRHRAGAVHLPPRHVPPEAGHLQGAPISYLKMLQKKTMAGGMLSCVQ